MPHSAKSITAHLLECIHYPEIKTLTKWNPTLVAIISYRFSVVQIPLRKYDESLVQEKNLDNVENGDQGILEKSQTATAKIRGNKGKEKKVREVAKCITRILNTQKPHFRYTAANECSKIMKEKFQDVEGTQSIKEVSKFFLNIDVDDV